MRFKQIGLKAVVILAFSILLGFALTYQGNDTSTPLSAVRADNGNPPPCG